ncbi:farnesyl pyrophosphate synthetase [Schizosaccharomyces cryophilus OY26]|uniref:Farnesyl pyrophosphate synthetase n=1 Tax=Schizosaccharomyces cryophilus (strain OY26 / ATCC MYA-4695 / CBS 11777 / NBRC 106824 / NRRL Y48691) TaxID=653667 RepID=S9W6T8_SCHCR|nr:farnesyl pyrophosphate synthetase [Schizosaccharomyces cryophilus OY26]EPY54264.1 farnesyl pyrophosphate synthetase [Schizosaccharomyces cryophilus OY26]
MNIKKTREYLAYYIKLKVMKHNESQNILEENREKIDIKQKFILLFPIVLRGLEEILDEIKCLQSIKQSLLLSLQRNTLGGKNFRGLCVIESLNSLLGRDLRENEFSEAAILGWLIEILQGCFLMADDIMDNSSKRRGLECWYREVGIARAFNDSQLLEACIPLLLRKFYKAHPFYLDLLELFREVTFLTELGEQKDLLSSAEAKRIFSFDLKNYDFIVTYKTSFYSFYLPVKCALLLSGNLNEQANATTKRLSKLLGYYFQAQDDFLDCFGNYASLGKVGMDIEDNKCTWLVCQAKMTATAEQLMFLEKHYGRRNQESVLKVKQLYREIGIPNMYQNFEEAMVEKIMTEINGIDESTGMKKIIFFKFFKLIHKRSR